MSKKMIIKHNKLVCRALLLSLITACVYILPSSCDVDPSLLCSREYCRVQNCTSVPIHCSFSNATYAGKSMLDPTFCNCCEFCLVYLLEGDVCSQGGLGTPPTGNACGSGLSCQSINDGIPTCQRMSSICHDAQDNYDKRREDGTLGMTEQRAECDEEGLFGHKVCLSGQTCFCQNSDGERIFGEILNENNAPAYMSCECSRSADMTSKLHYDFPRSLRCNIDGSYDPLQCVEGRCFCVNTVTGILGSSKIIDLVSQPLTDLPCFNRSLHHSHLSYYRQCEEDVDEMKKEIAKAEAEGYSFLGNPFPNCQPNGWYGSVMDTVDRKICVDQYGNQIQNYEAPISSGAADNMDCKCARTVLLVEQSQALSYVPACCSNGNWDKVQCRRGFCYCVDSNGVQQGLEVDASLTSTLACYNIRCPSN